MSELAESELLVAFLVGESAKQNVPGLFQWTAEELEFYNWLRHSMSLGTGAVQPDARQELESSVYPALCSPNHVDLKQPSAANG